MSRSENQLLIQLEWTSWKRHDLTVMRNVQCAQWESHREIIFLPERSEHASRWTESTWISWVHQWFRWKVINMLLWLLIVALANSSYQWLYGLKTKDGALMAVKNWYSDMAELLDVHKIYEVMRDNSGENSSKEIREFLESKIPREFKTISAQRTSNCRMAKRNRLSILSWSLADLWW